MKREKKEYLTEIYIIVIPIILGIDLYLRMMQEAVVNIKGEPCLYDTYIIAAMYGISLYIVPFVLYYVLRIVERQLNSIYIIRMVTIRKVWWTQIKKILVNSVLFSFYITIVTGVIGITYTKKIYNWDLAESRGSRAAGKVITERTPLLEIILCFFVMTFTVLTITAIIMLLTWWFSSSFLLGYITSLIIVFLEDNIINYGIFWRLYKMTMGMCVKRISVCQMFVYPLCLIILAVVLSCILVPKRDFWQK